MAERVTVHFELVRHEDGTVDRMADPDELFRVPEALPLEYDHEVLLVDLDISGDCDFPDIEYAGCRLEIHHRDEAALAAGKRDWLKLEYLDISDDIGRRVFSEYEDEICKDALEQLAEYSRWRAR